jgi:hypothetical protein
VFIPARCRQTLHLQSIKIVQVDQSDNEICHCNLDSSYVPNFLDIPGFVWSVAVSEKEFPAAVHYHFNICNTFLALSSVKMEAY